MERIYIKGQRQEIASFPLRHSSTQGTLLAFGIWNPGLSSEMRKDWPMGYDLWSQGKDSMHGQSWEHAKQKVPRKCQAKGSGLRVRNNQVLGKGWELRSQDKASGL